MTSFSERFGHVKKPEFLQLDSMNDRLNNLLCNFVYNTIENTYSHLHDRPFRYFQNSRIVEHANGNLSLLPRFDILVKHICEALAIPDGSFKLTNADVNVTHDFKKFYNALEWHEKYTVLETIFEFIDDRSVVEKVNSILERERSAYRLDAQYEFIAITNKEELKSIDDVRSFPFKPVSEHFDKAISLFSDRENPDYANAVKEVVSALETLAQHLLRDDTATLGKAIKKLDKVPPTLQDGIKKIYGYTSSEGGIRHGNSASTHTVDFTEAKFIIVVASALVNFIGERYKDEVEE